MAGESGEGGFVLPAVQPHPPSHLPGGHQRGWLGRNTGRLGAGEERSRRLSASPERCFLRKHSMSLKSCEEIGSLLFKKYSDKAFIANQIA